MNVPSTAAILLRAIFSLATILALIFALSWFLRRLQKFTYHRGDAARLLSIEDSLMLGPGRSLYVVRAGDRKILIGTSGQHLVYLGDLANPVDAGHESGACEDTGSKSDGGGNVSQGSSGAADLSGGQNDGPGVHTPLILLAGIALAGTIAIMMASATFFPGRISAAPLPQLQIGVGQATNPQDVVTSLQILAILTILTLAPAILIMMTSFTRIVIVLSFVRNALGFQQTPPNQVIIGLSLFLTLFVMAPTFNKINETALQPYLKGQLTQETAYKNAMEPIREFMFKQTREKDLALFVGLAKAGRPRNPGDVPTYVLIPAFIISEIKTAFEIGFVIYIPFLVIDMVVASTLMSMGMLMLPPVMISLPFKILLFVMVDGWNLVVGSLLKSFHG